MRVKCRVGKRKDKHKNSSRIMGHAYAYRIGSILYRLDLSDSSFINYTGIVLRCNECGYTRLYNQKEK